MRPLLLIGFPRAPLACRILAAQGSRRRCFAGMSWLVLQRDASTIAQVEFVPCSNCGRRQVPDSACWLTMSPRPYASPFVREQYVCASSRQLRPAL